MEVMNTARTRQHMLEMDSNAKMDCDEEHSDTWVFPLVQMKPLGIRLDEEVTQKLLMEADGKSTVYLTSGYFNLTQTYMRLVLGAAADYCILMASPEVNGFFGAKGVAGAIPEAYVHLAHQFYSKVSKNSVQLCLSYCSMEHVEYTVFTRSIGSARLILSFLLYIETFGFKFKR